MIVDDHPAWRTTLRMYITTLPYLTIVGEAPNGKKAIDLCQQINPDLVLLDIKMPGMDGFETAKALLADQPNLWIIGVSAEDNRDYKELAKKAGVDSVILKDKLMDYFP